MSENYYEFYINGTVEDNTDISGVFSLRADSQEEKVLDFVFTVIHNSRIAEFDLSSEFTDFRKVVENNMLNLSEHEPGYNLVRTINSDFENLMDGEKIKKVFEFITASRDPFLKNVLIKDVLSEVFRKLYKKTNLNLEIKFSLANPEENIMDIVTDAENQQGDSGKGNLIKIKINPVLDPVSGIAVNKLRPGDMFCFKVLDRNIDFSAIEGLIDSDQKDETRRIYKSVISDIKHMEASGSSMIQVSMGELYLGEAALQEELKVQAEKSGEKTDEESIIESNEEDLFNENEERMPVAFYGIIGVLVIFIFIVVYMLFF